MFKTARGDLEVILTFSRKENWDPERNDLLKILSAGGRAISRSQIFCVLAPYYLRGITGGAS